jgi:hypothetical protein
MTVENSERTQREERLGLVIIQLCPLPFREQMKPMLVMALNLLDEEQLTNLERDMVGIPEDVERGDLTRLIAVGKKFGVGTDIDPGQLAAMMLPKDGSG